MNYLRVSKFIVFFLRGKAALTSFVLQVAILIYITVASRKADMSDSDTDSDVVFESRNKPSSRYNSDNRNGYKSRNGFSKMGRRIKT